MRTTKSLRARVALMAGGAALTLAQGRAPTAQALPGQAIAGPSEQQAHLVISLATATTAALVIFVTAFLLGLWCGWAWRSRRL